MSAQGAGASANIVVDKPNCGGKPKNTTNFKKKSEKNEKVKACLSTAKKGILQRIAATARTRMMESQTRR